MYSESMDRAPDNCLIKALMATMIEKKETNIAKIIFVNAANHNLPVTTYLKILLSYDDSVFSHLAEKIKAAAEKSVSDNTHLIVDNCNEISLTIDDMVA